VPLEDDAGIASTLKNSKTIAVVGASPKPWRDSGSITRYLMQHGYDVYPVNPAYDELFDKKCYKDLKSIPVPIDIVDVFRNSDAVDSVVEEAIAVNARTIWLQLGVINGKAAAKAERAGLQVIMDHCIAVDHSRLIK
jgi:predicted CoA-binding protein